MKKLIFYRDFKRQNIFLENRLFPKSDSHLAFPPKIILSGMIEFSKKEAEKFGSVWESKYIGCRIEDHNFSLDYYGADLPSLEMIFESKIKYAKYSAFNILHKAFVRIFKDYEHFDSSKQNANGFTIFSTNGNRYSRNELTEEELQLFLNKASKEECQDRNANMTQCINNLQWEHTRPSKQFPIVFHIFGNDDNDYVKVFDTLKTAQLVLDEILKKPNFKYIQNNFVRN